MMMKRLVMTMGELHHTCQCERSTWLSTYLELGDAPWTEAAEHSQRVQLEWDLVCKAAVHLAWEKMEWVEEEQRIREREGQ